MAVIAPILLVMGVLAVISSGNSWKEFQKGSMLIEANASLSLHIAVSLVTYSLVTIASAAGYAGIIQGRALKSKQPTPWTRELPALSRCDAIMFKFLTIAEIILAMGLLSGMALQYQDSGKIISFDHKTVLTLIAFSLIGAVLIVHRLSGLRGRVAARWSLSAYLFLTLGYLGVKLVTDILLD